MFAIVKLLEMMAKKGTRPHKLIREIPPGFIVKEKVACPWEKKGTIMRHLMEDSQGKDVQLIDGIKIFFPPLKSGGDKDKDWIVAYPSQDHAYFYLVSEASTKERAEEIVNIYKNKIEEWQR